ncbi:glutamate-1-semialdehyde 2,1-aminomutase [Candidatus Palauibacter sp.]|uniref:glutamate-1-semialdehyde 2,1-aminomutase n=1 Tax=Candidatus Palauibacter sp. TaxID=3101350 RepID=UPI003D14434D
MSGGPRQPSVGSDWIRRARNVMPGGVSSPVRAFRAVGMEPLFAARGEGARIFDEAGRGYLDYVLSWGPLILGHAAPPVVEAVARAARDGMSFGACQAREVQLAERVAAWVPGVEMVRFVNSGTEATMSAVRLARAATGRDLILKFEGCYHGHADAFLVVAGSGVATLSLPDSPGVPAAISGLTLTAPYNDLGAVAAVFAEHGARLAAVIVEPVAGNAGLIPPREGFLEGLRESCDRAGTLLIFDEVMTGFRVARGGAQERYGVAADLVTLGKVLGAGLPVAAYAGPRELMRRMAPAGEVYQAGTLSGNPLGMAAGIAQLDELERTDPFAGLERRAATLVDGILAAASARGIPACGTALGSMWGVFFTRGPVFDFDGARRADTDFFARYYRACFERGVFFAPSAFEAGFLSTAHTDADVAETLRVVGEALDAALDAAPEGTG